MKNSQEAGTVGTGLATKELERRVEAKIKGGADRSIRTLREISEQAAARGDAWRSNLSDKSRQ